MTDDAHLYLSWLCWAKRPLVYIRVSSPADGPKTVIISGPGSLEVGVPASFTCSAECTPSCSFTWTLYGKTMTGSGIDITVNRYVSQESISCQAENTYTGKMATVNETLSVSGRVLLEAWVFSDVVNHLFELQCMCFSLQILTGVDVKTLQTALPSSCKCSGNLFYKWLYVRGCICSGFVLLTVMDWWPEYRVFPCL